MLRYNYMIITCDQFKEAKGIISNEFDEQIESLLPMVNDAVEKYCGREFTYGSYTERNDGICDVRGMYLFRCQNKPVDVASGVSINIYYYGGQDNPIALDSTKLDLFSKSGVVKYAYGMTDNVYLRDSRQDFYYDITYVGGYSDADMPAGLKLGLVHATGDLFFHYYGDQIADGKTARMSEKIKITVDDYSEVRGTSVDKSKIEHNAYTGVLFSQTTKNLLAPYRKAGIA